MCNIDKPVNIRRENSDDGVQKADHIEAVARGPSPSQKLRHRRCMPRYHRLPSAAARALSTGLRAALKCSTRAQ